jgi:predicted nuclease with RNAse H fold
MPKFSVVGVDLAGVPHRPTGICILRNLGAQTMLAYTDDEILNIIDRERPNLVTIDAPLALPPGRKSIHHRNDQHYRPCDLELRQRKIPFFPITLGPMRGLTERGIALKNMINKNGFQVVEIYPGGAQDIWGIPRVKHDMKGLRNGLRRLGIKGLREDCSDHELDAATAALVGHLYLQGKAEIYGDLSSGAIIMPRSV